MINKDLDNLATASELRAQEFFREHRQDIFVRTDRLFAILFPIQWLTIILIAYFVSPLLLNGVRTSALVNAGWAFFLGGIIISLPTFLTLKFAGATMTRYIVAVSQILLSSLLMYLTGGHIEINFHIFGSLIFLALYRDWRILVPATVIFLSNYLLSNIYYPLSIYENFANIEWRWLEHLGWILFEELILVISIHLTVNRMWQHASYNALVEAKEEKYRAVVEQTEDGIALVNRKSFRIIECNEAFSNLLGCESVEDAKSYKAQHLECENDWMLKNRILENADVVFPLTLDKTLLRRDGTSVAVETTVNLITFGGKDYYCINLKDISERKRAEAELSRLAIVAQKTQDAVVITDDEGVILWVNEGFTTLTEYQFDEAVGNFGYMLQGAETDAEVVETIRTTMWARKPYTGEIYNYKKDGKGFWCSVSITPWRDDDGEIQGFVSILTDISDRKGIEEELRRTQDELEHRVIKRTAELSQMQQYLRKVIDSVPNLIFVKDDQRRFRLANQAVADFHGTTLENLIGRTFNEVSNGSPEGLDILLEDQKILEDFEGKTRREEKFTDAQGNSHWLQIVKMPLRLTDDDSRYILGIVTDLTERKHLETQLRHSQKMESIGQLAAGIAHEINTPAQYVSDNTLFVRDSFSEIREILKDFKSLLNAAKTGNINSFTITELERKIHRCDLEYLTEEIPNAVEQSLEGVSRISNIVRSMRTFSHPGNTEKEPADLNRALESTILVTKNEWKYVAELDTDFDETLPLVHCLRDDFNRVILNMIVNAAHSIGESVSSDNLRKKGKITIRTRRIGNQWAEVQISDNGTGIPPEVQNRIFDPFFTTKEVGKGTGQGLAISHSVIVEKHQGQITFETVKGVGTTFYIRIPLQPAKKNKNNIALAR